MPAGTVRVEEEEVLGGLGCTPRRPVGVGLTMGVGEEQVPHAEALE